MVVIGVVHLVVNAENDGYVLAFCRGRDDNFFDTAAEVLTRVLGLCKPSGRLDNDLGPDLVPGYLGRVLFRKYAKLVTIDIDRILAARYAMFQIAHYRVVFEQMGKG